MALDETDKRLVNGLIYLVVIGALAYYFPWHLPVVGFAGYQAQKAEEGEARLRLQEKSKVWDRFYPPMHPAHFGDYSADPAQPALGKGLAELRQEYIDAGLHADKLIALKEESSRMQFPDWTEIPATDREPGVYFAQMWQRKKNQLTTMLIEKNVVCLDPDVGFGRYKGLVNITKNEAEEYLRELCIAEKIILLCMDAKAAQEADERKWGNNEKMIEAYMKIVSITPQRSVATGPSILLPNPKYSPDEKNPMSERFRKYNVRVFKNFIQEYPVEIVLQCDVNSFMRFLHAVRTPGQFLVIRNLQIMSQFIEDSLADKMEMQVFKAEGEKQDLSRKVQLQESHILVKMSAAGMDFFDPVKYPRGLYETGTAPVKRTNSRARYVIPTE